MLSKEQGFQQALKNYEGALIRYTLKVTGDLECAKEVVQEAFLKLWKQDWNKVSDHIPQWLYVVCKNLAIDRLRKTKGRRQEQDVNTFFDLKALPDQELLKTQVFSKIMKLKPVHQEVLILKFQEGRSYIEISEITGHSPSHVGVLIHEAMKALRYELKEVQ